MGPDLRGVTERRDRRWLARWLKDPGKMLDEKDPLAMALLAQSQQVVMPTIAVSDEDVANLIAFLEAQTRRVAAASRPAHRE